MAESANSCGSEIAMQVSGKLLQTRQAITIVVCSSLALAFLLLLAYFWIGNSSSSGTTSATPDYYLWAWRRAEDLSFIESGSAHAAIWTATIFIEDGRMSVERRTVPVTYPADIDIVAVTRLEIRGVYGVEMAMSVAAAILETGAPFRPVEYQVDFDTLFSQRSFYRLLLLELRNIIGDAELSITALASWCLFDNWIAGLPIDSAVPMVYRLGNRRESIVTRLRAERAFMEPICAGNVGYSADEPAVWLRDLERVFLFHPLPWTRERFQAFIDQLEELR